MGPRGACLDRQPQPSKQPCHRGVVLGAGGRCHSHPRAAGLASKRLFQLAAAALGRASNRRFPALLLRGKAGSRLPLGTRGRHVAKLRHAGCCPEGGAGLPAWLGVVGIAWQPGRAVSLPGTRSTCKGVTRFAQGHQVLQQNLLAPQQCAVPARQPVAGAMWPHKTPSGSIPLGEILLDSLPAGRA